MNRLLLIPCITSCLGFVFLASSGRVDNASANHYGVAKAVGENGAEPFLSSQEIQDGLIAKWKLYSNQKYAFSRVIRPEQYNTRPGILVNDALQSPDGSFVGLFVLEQLNERSGLGIERPIGSKEESVESRNEFPIVMDRRTGDAIIFSSGKWSEFSEWAVNGE